MVIVFLVFTVSSLLSSIIVKYAGWIGVGSDMEDTLPFSNMDTTDDMSGLLLGSSSTQSSPTWMQTNASSAEQLPAMDGSTTSLAFPSLHKLHAYTKQYMELDIITWNGLY